MSDNLFILVDPPYIEASLARLTGEGQEGEG